MSVSYKHFLDSAESILNDKNSEEIDFRNLISRSYYAAFLLARDKSKNILVKTSKKSGSHEEVIAKFCESTDSKLQRLGGLLMQLKLKRCNADYDTHLDIKRYETAQHFHNSKGLISQLEKI